MGRKKFNWDSKFIQLIELVIDLSLVLVGLITVLYISGEYRDISLLEAFDSLRDLIVTNLVMIVTIFIFFRVYNTSITKNGFLVVMPRIILALIMTGMITVFVSLFMPTFTFSKTYFIYSLLIQISYLAIFKFIFYQFFKRVNIKTVLIIGPQKEAESIAEKLLMDSEKYLVLKYLIFNSDFNNGNYNYIYDYIDKVDYVYLTPKLYENKKNAIISYCIDNNRTFYLIPKFYELAVMNAKVAQVGDVLAYEVRGLEISLEGKIIKRIFDIVVSIVGIIITLPILILVSIVIRISDGGPALFTQERLTLGNKKFILYKFRTMVIDAERNTGPVLAEENDFRITKLGNFLRKTRIDELPQFFNILKGEMSLVGPRPEREFFVEQFIKENSSYKYRMNVKAGVTGLAQALGKYNTTFEDKLRFDLYYIRNYSFFEDISILLHTIRAITDKNSSKGIIQNSSFENTLIRYGLTITEDKEYNCIKNIISIEDGMN